MEGSDLLDLLSEEVDLSADIWWDKEGDGGQE